MANRLDEAVAEVKDGVVRKKLQDAIADMKKKQRFGLVFEEHIPETTALIGLPIHVGATVQRRDDPSGRSLYVVNEVNGGG
jgi:adenine-specific DNA-methyltransferase